MRVSAQQHPQSGHAALDSTFFDRRRASSYFRQRARRTIQTLKVTTLTDVESLAVLDVHITARWKLRGAIQQLLDQEDAIREIAGEYTDGDAFFFIGRYLGTPVALEGALKLKEVAYVHAEGFAAGELKHGPLALVTPKTPVLAVLTEGARPDETLNNVKEVESRGAPVVGFSSYERGEKYLDTVVDVPGLGC